MPGAFGLKTDRFREDVALLQLLLQDGRIDAARFGQLKQELQDGGASRPIERMLEAGEIALDDWRRALEVYEAEFFVCPACNGFLRAPDRSPVLRCGKCDELFDNPAGEPVVAPTEVESHAPDDPPRANGRETALLELAVEAGQLAADQARWAAEQARAARARGVQRDAGAVLCGAGLLEPAALQQLEQQLERRYAHCPASGALIPRDDGPCADCGAEHPPAAALVAPVTSETPDPPAPRPRPHRRRRTRRPAPPRLLPEEAQQLLEARRRIATAQPEPAPQRPPRKPSRPRPPTRRNFAPAPDPRAPRIEGPALAEKLAADEIDLSGCRIASPVDLAGRKLKRLVCRGAWFESTVDLRGATIAGKAEFAEASFAGALDARKALFKDGADFGDAHFFRQAQFNQARFTRYLRCREATFEAAARFTRVQLPAGAGFERCRFLGEASFNELFAGHRAQFERCSFDQGASFSNSAFAEVFDISGSVFAGPAKLMGCQFDRPALFNDVTFQGPALFIGSLFRSEATFRGGCFQGKVDFQGVSAERTLLFQGLAFGQAASFHFSEMHVERFVVRRGDLEGRIESEQQRRWGKARAEYGLLKHNFRAINAYADEDWAYLMEKRMARRSIRLTPGNPLAVLRRFLDWLALDLACGYGTRPLNILGAACAVIALFALAYLPLFPDGLGLADALLMSFKAFTGAQIETWKPRPGSAVNFVVALESFLGIFVMTVLVVTFSRKVIR